MKFQTAKITERGTVTIPEQFRKKYGFITGDRVIFIGETSGLFLKSARNVDFKELDRILEKTKKIKPRHNLTAEQMDELNERLFR